MKRKLGAVLLVLVLVLTLGLVMTAPVAANPGDGLVALWHLDDGSGTSAVDSSGNDNDGTLQPSGSEPSWTTSGYFDASTIDPLSVELAGASVRVKGKSGNVGSLEDVNGDGYLDLVVQVYTTQLILIPGDGIADLTGLTYSGLPFRGSDSVRIVPE